MREVLDKIRMEQGLCAEEASEFAKKILVASAKEHALRLAGDLIEDELIKSETASTKAGRGDT